MVRGCIKTKADIAILSAPTPTRKLLDQPDIFLFIIPCTILAIPLNSKANAPNNIKNSAVCIGNDITTMPSATTRAPRPILVRRDEAIGDGAIPIAILSNPTISKATENSRIIVYIAIPGYVRITIDNMIEIAPRPICTNRNQIGDFIVLLLDGFTVVNVIYKIKCVLYNVYALHYWFPSALHNYTL